MTFKWTAPRTWVAAETPPAATLNAHIRDQLEALNGYVTKAADESVTSSTVLQNDDHLLWAIPQAGTYVIDVYLLASSAANAAGDINVGFSFPAGTMSFDAHALDVSLASGFTGTMATQGTASATSGTTALGLGLSTSITGIRIHGLLTATASGTLQFMWCQNSSNANASTVKARSHMTIRQVAA